MALPPSEHGSPQLDEGAWSGTWAPGKVMQLERAVVYVLSEEEPKPPTLVAVLEQQQPQPPADEPSERLTAREREVALLVGRGLTNRQIAKEFSISKRTAEHHVARILKRLGLHSRAQVAAWATEQR